MRVLLLLVDITARLLAALLSFLFLLIAEVQLLTGRPTLGLFYLVLCLVAIGFAGRL